jgi:hypothetical protein
MLAWNSHYPNPKLLKREIACMCDAFVEILFETIPKNKISGIYLKGSAQKEWNSPLDYVPEISDIDIHVLFSDNSTGEKYFGSTKQVIKINSLVETRYFDKILQPYHIPRPQLLVLNQVLDEENFVSSPKGTIAILFGKQYPESGDDKIKRVREIDRRHLLDEEQFLKKYPLHVIDKPSKYLWQALRDLVWHVSPIGSRILSIKGFFYEAAWALNRTKIVTRLKETGEPELAYDYAQFYLHGWEYFLSHYANTNAGRKAIVAGIDAITRAVRIVHACKKSSVDK